MRLVTHTGFILFIHPKYTLEILIASIMGMEMGMGIVVIAVTAVNKMKIK